MEIQVYGRITEVLNNMQLDASDFPDTDELKRRLLTLFPSLADVRFTIAVNNRIITEKTTLHTEDVIALLPPFSGG